MSATATAIASISDLGAPAEMAGRAQEGLAPRTQPRFNAHIHLPPNFSAFDTVEQAIDLAAAQDVRVLGVSNYYDYSVYADFARRATEHGIFPLFGTEIICLVDDLLKAGVKINDPGNPGKFYLCGKGIGRFDPLSTMARDLMDVIRRNDSTRMARMTDKLAEVFAQAGLETGLNENAVKERVVRRHNCPLETVYLQERHVAQAFQEALFERLPAGERGAFLQRLFGAASKNPEDAAGVQNEIRSHLMKAGKSAFVEETFVGFDHACGLILALGGIPCYPTLADGTSPLCGYEDPVQDLISRLREKSLHCAEYIPVRNSAESLTHYVTAMRQAGMIVTAGTEHNTRDLLPIEPTCAGGEPIPDAIRDIFWEGACVVAAHQYLTLHGDTGYVDAQGALNPAFSSGEERIAAFSRLGAAVIRTYQDAHPA